MDDEKVISYADPRVEELHKMVKEHWKRFSDMSNQLHDEALALHRKQCSNPPGSMCEGEFMGIYMEMWVIEERKELGNPNG